MSTVVITQPMYFPWVGMLEQMSLADALVYLDDAQFSKGGLFNRVKIKSPRGLEWLTVPLTRQKLASRINEMTPAGTDWKKKHLTMLEQSHSGAPHAEEMIRLAESVLGPEVGTLADLSTASMDILADYFGISTDQRLLSSRMQVEGSGSERVLAICRKLNASRYVTGHGAANYLDHESFEAAGIAVEYMDYAMRGYDQLHGEFTPYVSALDLVANCGSMGGEMISPRTVSWKEHCNE